MKPLFTEEMITSLEMIKTTHLPVNSKGVHDVKSGSNGLNFSVQRSLGLPSAIKENNLGNQFMLQYW